ncbi:MAG: hypothetical protein WCO84_07215 [bacterium]
MSDEVNVTVSDETPIQVSVIDVDPFAVTVAEDSPITVTPVQESLEITVVENDSLAVELSFFNGNLLRFTSEILDVDGEETSFVLAHAFIPGSLAIFRNGILASDEYVEKADKSGIDFATAPESDDEIEARYAYI